jgi:hypothetical protein
MILVTVARAEELQLRDQFGVSGGLLRDGSGPQVAIVVSAKRLRRIKPWERALRERDPEVPLVRVADVPRTAPTEYATVAAKLRKRLPEDVSVLVDLEGQWATTYGLDTSVPNLLVFDATGELLARHMGMYSVALFEAFHADLQRARGEPVAQSP